MPDLLPYGNKHLYKFGKFPHLASRHAGRLTVTAAVAAGAPACLPAQDEKKPSGSRLDGFVDARWPVLTWRS
jgi:hypothetical protein